MAVESRMNLGLRFGVHEMVGGGDMQHQRMGDRMAFVQHLVDHDAIIADRRIDVGARRGHIGEPPAKAEADRADLFRALRAQPADRGLDVLDAVVGVILAEIAECLLQFGLHIGIEFDARRETPEDVGRDGQIALRRPIVAFLADARIDAENLRDHDDRAGAVGVGARDIGRDFVPAVECGDGGVRRGHGGGS